MRNENEELYLMKLKQFIHDEDQIVTAIWLSKKFNINMQQTHNLLKQFIIDEKSSNNAQAIGISYILIGTVNDAKNESETTVMIIKEHELENKKKMFVNISSENVYSIQKAKDVNLNTVSLVDMFNIHTSSGPILGCAVGLNCVKRTNMPNKKPLATVSRAPATDKSKASHLFTATSTNKNPPIAVKKEEKVAPKNEAKATKLTKHNSNSADKAKNSIATMFAKAPAPKEKAIEKVNENETIKAEAMDIDDFASDEEKEKPQTTKNSKEMLYDSGTDEEAKKVEENNKAREKKTSSVTKKGKSKRQRDKSVENPQKKRKRIVELVESDDDIFGDEDQDDNADNEIIESDDEPVYKKPVKKELPEKNRKRKLVEKTYTDEEGYNVVKKEWVYDSNAEEEEDADEDKENPPAVKKEAKTALKQQPKNKENEKEKKSPKESATKGKKKQSGIPSNQPTLMNFFKKK